MAVAGSLVLGYVGAVVLLAVVSGTAAADRFSLAGILLGAIPAWLAAYHVPLGLPGGQLGVLPLLPTALLMALVAGTSLGAATQLRLRRPGQAWPVVAAMAGAHAVVGCVLSLVTSGGPVRTPPAVAFFGCAAVAGAAATLGIARRCGLARAVRGWLDPVTARGIRAGVLAITALLGVGAAALAVGLTISWPTTSALFGAAGAGVGGAFGMWLLCLGYLPNAVVAATSFVVGSGMSVGQVSVGPVEFTGGPLPSVPLFAALPEQSSWWLPLVLVLPGAVGVLVGWACRLVAARPAARVRAVLVAGLTAAVGCLVLAALAGGALANGPFDPVRVPAGLFAVLTLGWIALPGAVVAWFAAPPAPVARPANAAATATADTVATELDGAETASVDSAPDPAADPAPAPGGDPVADADADVVGAEADDTEADSAEAGGAEAGGAEAGGAEAGGAEAEGAGAGGAGTDGVGTGVAVPDQAVETAGAGEDSGETRGPAGDGLGQPGTGPDAAGRSDRP
ncbi:hypothetical protein LX83_002586 [Goodfellowiella coeruleoviolacea]|uniref:Uncharacterized protein n=2 Tax=Goodfellowiella coeruleoviolacea TaxID=334858 RepID=A0AAE3KKS4_9PSEU|nr:hypothetical protein [Goodfellowiella coeruleoviolacea]